MSLAPFLHRVASGESLSSGRITLVARQGESGAGLREESTVQYAMSAYRVVLPAATEQREFHGAQVKSENKFAYPHFPKFQTSSYAKLRDVP
jgi:hypothetical protein